MRSHHDVAVTRAEERGRVARRRRVDGPQLVEVEVRARLDGRCHEAQCRLDQEGWHRRRARHLLRRVGDELHGHLLEAGEGRVQHDARDAGVPRRLEDRAHSAHATPPQRDGRRRVRVDVSPQVVYYCLHVVALVPAERDVLAVAVAARREVEREEGGARSEHRRDHLQEAGGAGGCVGRACAAAPSRSSHACLQRLCPA
eukprot:scaffold58946_cov63-Phaeocystis_antarctica.AAC.5